MAGSSGFVSSVADGSGVLPRQRGEQMHTLQMLRLHITDLLHGIHVFDLRKLGLVLVVVRYI